MALRAPEAAPADEQGDVIGYVVFAAAIVVYDAQGAVLATLDPDDRCSGWTLSSPPCGGCTECMLQQCGEGVSTENVEAECLTLWSQGSQSE